MMQNTPVKIINVVGLQTLQIDPKYFKFGVTNFESDKYICIRDAIGVRKKEMFFLFLKIKKKNKNNKKKKKKK